MWQRKKLLHTCDVYGTGYAQDAFIDKINDTVWRIYYSTRTADVVSYPFYMDVEAGNVENILKVYDAPLLHPGPRGSFDDSGITPTSIVQIDEHRKYLYYCGWNRKVSVPYALSIGCAEILHDCECRKISEGPIMDRSIHNPIAVSAPCVLKDNGMFGMWYISFLAWEPFNGRTEPIYVIKHATSDNGLDWRCDSHICVDAKYYGEALGRPWVIKDEGIYKMWFSARGMENYRSKFGQHYMIEYAESPDGLHWERQPDKFFFPTADHGWDSDMLEYASVTKHKNTYIMLYNGNDFGKTGFGYAELVK